MVARTVLLASLGCRWADGGAFFRSHFRASFLADANGSQVPSPHGTVPAGQGAAMRTETAAADAARGMRQRIDENRTLHCETLQPVARAMRRLSYAVR